MDENNKEPVTPRRSGRARKPKNFDNFEVGREIAREVTDDNYSDFDDDNKSSSEDSDPEEENFSPRKSLRLSQKKRKIFSNKSKATKNTQNKTPAKANTKVKDIKNVVKGKTPTKSKEDEKENKEVEPQTKRRKIKEEDTENKTIRRQSKGNNSNENIVEKQKKGKKKKSKKERKGEESESEDEEEAEETDDGKTAEEIERNKKMEEVWSVVRPQYQTMCNILEEAGIGNLLMTSYLLEENFNYLGSERGMKFLQNKVGFLEDKSPILKENQCEEQASTNCKFVWKIVEKQANQLITTLSEAGVDSLMLTSLVDQEDGFGFQGSEKGLKFIQENPDIGKLFMVYCNGDDSQEMEFQKSNIFTQWFKYCGGVITEEVEDDHTYSTETGKKRSSRRSQIQTTDVPLDLSLVDPDNPQCPVCSKYFRTEKILKKHYLLHIGEKEYECTVCQKKFLRKYDMQNHQIRMHDFVNISKGEVISPESAVALNITGDFNAEDIKKEPSDTVEKENEEEGLQNLSPNVESKVEDASFLNGDIELSEDGDVEQHLAIKNDPDGTGNESVRCPKCFKMLKNEAMLKKHLENHSAPKEIRCLVESCDKVFKRKWDMEYHVVTIHDYIKLGPGNVVPYQDVPEEVRIKLKKRRRADNSEDEGQEDDDPVKNLKGTKCPECHKTFKTNIILKRHYVVHVGDKNFICEVCSKSFLRKYDLHIHQIKVHGYTKNGKGLVIKPEDDDLKDIDIDLLPANLKTHSRGKKRSLLKCEYCKMVSYTQNNLDIHLEKYHQDEFPFQCQDCNEKFQLKRKYKAHWYTHHANRKHQCPHCDKTFVFKFHLRDHMLTHEKSNRGFLCTLCGKNFSLLKYLRKHEQRHEEKLKNEEQGPKVYRCKICDETLNTLSEYQSHMKTHVDSEDRKFSCFECGKKFFKLGHLKRHSFVHIKERAYQCEHCDKRYKDPDTLKKHVICMHNVKFDRRKTYKCETCEKSFLSYGHLKRHVLCHTGEKPFQCDICCKNFKEKAGMIAHRRIHTGERPFVCTICNRSFVQPAHLRRHMFLHTQIRNFICQVCGKGYFQNDELKKHMTVHTQEKAYKCKFCNKAFHHLSSIRTHERTHSGVKPFECDVCNQRFTQKNSMLIHRRRHTNERPFKCSECGKCFASKQLCKLHIRSHFPENYPRHKCPKCDKDYSVKQKLRHHILKEHGEDDLASLPPVQRTLGKGDPIVLIIQNVNNDSEVVVAKDSQQFSIDEEEYDSEEMNNVDEESVQADINDFTCDICFMGFADAETLDKHKILHKDSEKSFGCDVCLELFAQREELHSHLVKSHGFIRSGDSCVRLEIDNSPTISVSPSKYLNKTSNFIQPSKNVSSASNTIIIPTVSSASAHSSSLIEKDGNLYQIINVAPKTTTNVVEKDGSILRIVTPCYTQESSVATTVTPTTTTVIPSPQVNTAENENHVVITSLDNNAYEIAPSSVQDDVVIGNIMSNNQELQHIQNNPEEIIETQTVPETIPQVPDTEVDTTLSQIDFDQEGGISETTAANLAALYGTDKIIYQEERNDGTEVVHVYAIIPKAD